MAETIESFVAKLQSEGVDAGRKQAEKIAAEAQLQADQIISDARKQAEKIISDAQADAANIRTRSQSELELAARDIVLRLRESLSKALTAVLAAGAKAKLEDVEFLGKTLHELIKMYAQSSLTSTEQVNINVPQEMRGKLVDWALNELGKAAVEGKHPALDLQGSLAEAGFTYGIDGATVEVTLSSVSEALCEMIEPSLHEMVIKAAGQQIS